MEIAMPKAARICLYVFTAVLWITAAVLMLIFHNDRVIPDGTEMALDYLRTLAISATTGSVAVAYSSPLLNAYRLGMRAGMRTQAEQEQTARVHLRAVPDMVDSVN